jgi:Protein of unknown function (DUF2585)
MTSLSDRMGTLHRVPLGKFLLLGGGLIVVQALILLAMGRLPICACGTVKFWHGIVQSSENSQHIFDWYSFSHMLHGFAFYFFAWLLLPRAPLGLRLVLAIFAEASWEILENTEFIINRYRTDTVSLNYHGDSIVNSVFDNISMIFGFVLASRLPVWVVIALTVVVEIGMAWLIRDNLALNIIMLIYPFAAIRNWQAGGALQ